MAGRLRVAQREACRTRNPAAARGGDYLIGRSWGPVTLSSSREITPRTRLLTSQWRRRRVANYHLRMYSNKEGETDEA
jgi:hypothetical protein